MADARRRLGTFGVGLERVTFFKLTLYLWEHL